MTSEGEHGETPATCSQCKLLIYTHAMAGGGAERVCAILASGLARSGSEVILAVDHEHNANRIFLDGNIRVVVLGGGHGRAVVRLSALLAREKPDVSLSAIGVSNVKHTLAAALCGRLGRVILSYHAFAISEPQILSRSAYWMASILSRVTARTVAVSHALRGNLIQRWHVSPKRTITIYNPVLVGSDTSPLPREPGTPRLVLAAGRLVPGKNMLGVIRAFNHIAARVDAHLVIVGEGPDRPALEAEIAALGLHDRVRLPGYVAEPWDLYRQASCFVSASPVESFSMVVAEALAYGLPVVAYDSPGPREVLAHGRYGTLVTPGDEAALGHAIFRALEAPGDEADRRAGGAAFSLQVGLDAYRRLFGEVIAENRRRGLFNRSSQLSIGRPHSLF